MSHFPCLRAASAEPHKTSLGGFRRAAVVALLGLLAPAVSSQAQDDDHSQRRSFLQEIERELGAIRSLAPYNRSEFSWPFNYGAWGGANRAPAEQPGLPPLPRREADWPQYVARNNLPQPIDPVDRAFMNHDLRFRIYRQDGGDVGFTSIDNRAAYTHLRLARELEAAQNNADDTRVGRLVSRFLPGVFDALAVYCDPDISIPGELAATARERLRGLREALSAFVGQDGSNSAGANPAARGPSSQPAGREAAPLPQGRQPAGEQRTSGPGAAQNPATEFPGAYKPPSDLKDPTRRAEGPEKPADSKTEVSTPGASKGPSGDNGRSSSAKLPQGAGDIAPREASDPAQQKPKRRGPFTVNYYRVGDYPKGGELDTTYKTLAEAMRGVAAIQKWAAWIAGNSPNSDWRIEVIEVVDESTGQKQIFRLNNRGNIGDDKVAGKDRELVPGANPANKEKVLTPATQPRPQPLPQPRDSQETAPERPAENSSPPSVPPARRATPSFSGGQGGGGQVPAVPSSPSAGEADGGKQRFGTYQSQYGGPDIRKEYPVSPAPDASPSTRAPNSSSTGEPVKKITFGHNLGSKDTLSPEEYAQRMEMVRRGEAYVDKWGNIFSNKTGTYYIDKQGNLVKDRPDSSAGDGGSKNRVSDPGASQNAPADNSQKKTTPSPVSPSGNNNSRRNPNATTPLPKPGTGSAANPAVPRPPIAGPYRPTPSAAPAVPAAPRPGPRPPGSNYASNPAPGSPRPAPRPASAPVAPPRSNYAANPTPRPASPAGPRPAPNYPASPAPRPAPVSPTAPRPSAPRPNYPASPAPRPAPAPRPSYAGSTPRPAPRPSDSGSWYNPPQRPAAPAQRQKVCGACRRVVPSSSQPGQTCPYCRAHWTGYR